MTPASRLSERALSESAFHRYLSFGALYFAQGLPVGLFFTAVPAWLATQGLGTAEIGSFTAFVTLPWSLKLIWGPILDRFGYLPMGKRRPWIILAQTGLFASLLLLSLVPDPLAHLSLVAAVGFAISVFASLQDVGVDGMAVDVLPVEQRGRASGVMFGAQRLGIALTAAGGATLLSLYGLHVVALVGASLVGLILLCPLLLRERPGERLFPWSPGEAAAAAQTQLPKWGTIFGGVFRALLLPASLVIGLVCLSDRIGYGVFLVIRPVLFVQTLEWTAPEYAQLLAVAGLVTAGSAVVLGPALVDRLGPLRTLVVALALEAVVNAAMSFLAPFWSLRPLVTSIVLVGAAVEGVNIVARSAVFMALCWKQTAATQFVFYTAIAGNLALTVGSGVTGPLNHVLDPPQIFLAIAAAQVGLCLLLRLVNLASHRTKIEALDATAQPLGVAVR
jgi:PAT family beta-lactamase induction signal transducer AmpG